MPFAPLHVLMAVIAADRSRFLDGLHTMGVYDRCRRLRIPAHTLPLRCPERSEDAVPHTTQAKAAEVVVDCLPRREVTREVAPRASRPEQVEDRVEDGAQRVAARSSSGLDQRHIAL